MVNVSPLAAEIVSFVWGTLANFNGFRVLAALLLSQSAAFNRGHHLYSTGRPSRWAPAHISSLYMIRCQWSGWNVLHHALAYAYLSLWSILSTRYYRGHPPYIQVHWIKEINNRTKINHKKSDQKKKTNKCNKIKIKRRNKNKIK